MATNDIYYVGGVAYRNGAPVRSTVQPIPGTPSVDIGSLGTGFQLDITGPDVIYGYGQGVNPDGTWKGQPTPAPQGDQPPADDPYTAYLKEQAAQQRDRLLEVTRTYFRENGMEAFITGMEKYIRQGYSGDQVMVMLSADPDYKTAWDTRFAGNVARAKNGLSQLLPAQYIALEQGYKQLFLRYGVPADMFDSPDDLAALIGNDVSPVEVNDRLSLASRYLNYAGNAEVKQQLKDIYGMSDGELLAYVLDPKKTQTYLESETRRNFARANVGGAAATQGVKLTNDFRDEIAGILTSNASDASFDAINSRFGEVAAQAPAYARLGSLSFVDATSDDLVREQFGTAGAADATNKKKALAAQERARFGGQSGLGSTSLSAGRRAQ